MAGTLEALLELEKRGELPAAQQSALDELRRRGEIPQRHEPASFSRGMEFVGKGVTKGLAHVAGAPVDIATAGINLATAGVENLTGKDIPGVPIERPIGGSQSISEALSGEATLMGRPQPEEAPVEIPPLTYGDISDVPSRFRPAARFGEVLGESAPLAAYPLARAGQLLTKPATGVTAPLVEQAKTLGPGMFAAQEAAIATGAGIGEATMEAVAPGNRWAQMGGGLTGALLSPASLFAQSSSKLAQTVRRTAETMTREGTETGAARQLQEMTQRFGESPGVLAEQLRKPGLPSATPAQKTASPALTALQQRMVRHDANLGLDVRRQTEQAIREVRQAFALLASRGDPESLALLGKAKQQHWNDLIDREVARVEEQLAGAAESVKPTSPQARTQANIKARELLEGALKDARKEEKVLWGDVDKSIDVAPVELGKTYKDVTGDLLEGESLNVSNKAILASIKAWTRKKKPKTPTSGDMLRLRSRIISEMRNIRGGQAPDWDLHHRLDNIQIAIVDDLEGVDEAAKTARDFSREMHDRITRSAAQRALGRDVRGAERIPEELTLEKTLASKPGPERAVASREMERAVEPFQSLPSTSRPRDMMEAQEEMVRDLASSTIDQTTGRIRPGALATFRERNKDLLQRFPQLARTLTTAQTTTQRYGDRLKTLAKRDKTVRENAAFKKVLSFEDPKRSIAAAMDSRFPVSDLSRIFQMARTNPNALKGATRATVDVLIRKATDAKTGLISGERLKGLLEENNLSEVARKYGVLTVGRQRRLKVIADEAAKLEASMKFGGEVGEIVGDVSDIFDLWLRWAGANVGGASALGNASGTSLVMAGHFSRTFRRWFEKVPANRVSDVIAEAVVNPDFMADLLLKPVTRPAIIAKDRRISSVLKSLGIEGLRRQVFHAGVLQTALPIED